MTTQAKFIELLGKEGFPLPVEEVQLGPGFREEHAHDFEVKALVTKGQIDIVINGAKTSYLAGDIFHLAKNQKHTESYSSQGVIYLASRKLGDGVDSE